MDPLRSTALIFRPCLPAISKWIQGVSSANSFKNIAAVMAPPQRPPVFIMSAMDDRICSLYSSSNGIRHIFSPAFSVAPRNLAYMSSSFANTPAFAYPKCDHNGPSQRCRVHQMRAAELAGIIKTIRQNQPAFCIGIDNLDRLA